MLESEEEPSKSLHCSVAQLQTIRSLEQMLHWPTRDTSDVHEVCMFVNWYYYIT